MKKTLVSLCLLLAVGTLSRGQVSNVAHWPQWRGPFFNGMANGAAPTQWSDTQNIKWKIPIPGKGHSTPVIWGDRIFLTTAIPTGKPASVAAAPAPEPTAATSPGQGRGRGPGGDSGPQPEHKFEVLCL